MISAETYSTNYLHVDFQFPIHQTAVPLEIKFILTTWLLTSIANERMNCNENPARFWVPIPIDLYSLSYLKSFDKVFNFSLPSFRSISQFHYRSIPVKPSFGYIVIFFSIFYVVALQWNSHTKVVLGNIWAELQVLFKYLATKIVLVSFFVEGIGEQLGSYGIRSSLPILGGVHHARLDLKTCKYLSQYSGPPMKDAHRTY